MDSRGEQLRTALVLGLAQDRPLQPNPQDFLGASAATVEGQLATETEVIRTVKNLTAYGLLTGVPVAEVDYLLRLDLTPEGRVVVDDFEGKVGAWQASRGGDHSVRVGHAVNVAAYSSNVTQISTGIDTNALRAAVQAVVEALPALTLGDRQEALVSECAAEIVVEATSAEPDTGRLRAAGHRLLGMLQDAGTAATGGALTDMLVHGLHAAGL